MEDDLEYSITFPSPKPDDSDDSEAVCASNIPSDNEPVVILLGWLGCQDKHLAKYSSAIYERKGFVTIRYVAPTDAQFYKQYLMKSIAAKVLELIFEYGLEESPIFFHLFSNGGCAVYSHITELIESNKDNKYSELKIQGCVFDSSPGQQRILNAIKAFMTTVKSNLFVKYLSGLILFLYLLVTILSCYLLTSLSRKFAQIFIFERLVQDPLKCPQLFLYSQADQVILAEDVEIFMKKRQEAGIKVSSLKWDDSPHVKHFISHRESYIGTCHDFIDNCLCV